MTTAEPKPSLDFIRVRITEDVKAGKNAGKVVTRFPPEPNGFLHIGHAKSICLNFGVAREFGGACHLRMDDTNPIKEEERYAKAMEHDVRWLGFDWGEHHYHTSDYFERLYDLAVGLIRNGKAYVESLSAEEIRAHRGTLTEPGTNSPHRDRPVEENLDLFERMRRGEFPDGTHVLRAKIDMAAPNVVMRDPTLYRIRHAAHARTGDTWCIYPMYDFAHCLSDSIEGITHSLCTLEFKNNRELYDWLIEATGMPCRPQQIEFARLNVGYMIMSKRKLLALVDEGHVAGWDDPRMPTLAGLRRRGYTPSSIRTFCERVGVAKRENLIDIALLEHTLREELNRTAPRVMGVLDPVRLVIENYPEGGPADGPADATEELDAINNPEDAAAGTRKVPFSRVLYVERADYMDDPPRKFHRLAIGQEVRLRYAYFVTCTGVERDPDTGDVVEIRCTYDPATRGGDAPDGRKVRGTIHWVSAAHALRTEVRLYDRLFTQPDVSDVPDGADWRSLINPASLETRTDAMVEPSLADAVPGVAYQLERQGYFCVDAVDSAPGRFVLNRTAPLRDSWSKIAAKDAKGG